jgi:PAS domain S-box-containing protein
MKRTDRYRFIYKDKTKEQLLDALEAVHKRNVQLEVSEKKHQQTMEALRKSEEKYHNLFENVNDIILSMDLKGNIIDANKKAEEISGYSREDLPVNVLSLINPIDALKFASRLKKLLIEKKLPPTEYTLKTKNGEKIMVEITSSLIEKKGKSRGIMVVGRDITERKKAEVRIKNSLKEKEVLLKEIHHRVKNNMQIISSLLHLQEMHLKDQSIRKAFRESQNRIRSMALIYEKLYHSEDLARIDMREYIDSLSADLFRTYNINPIDITLQNDVKDIYLTLETAIPCCLIINDLVSNSLKHAFPPEKDNMEGGKRNKPKGQIQVNFFSSKRKKTENEYTIVVRDNGIGFPDEFDYKKVETLGFQLVSMFVKKLRGTIALSSRYGAETRITFSSREGKK